MSNGKRMVFLSILALAFCAAQAAAEQAIIDIVRQVRPAVVTVTTYDSDGDKQSQGSGFFVDASHVITDWHVVQDANRIEVKADDGRTYAVKGIAAGGNGSDLASLVLATPNQGVKPLTVVATIPEAGEHVIVVGSPYGLDATVSDGIVSRVRDLPSLGRVIQISAPISRGSSGSPVVNMKGEVVGVAQAIRGDGQNINFAIPGAQVLAMKPGTGPVIASKPSTPSEQGAGPSASASDTFDRGYALFKSKSYSQALPFLLDATKKNPSHYYAWFAAGHCYVQLGQYSDAAAAFLNVVRLKPEFVEGYCSLGAALGLMGRHKQAIDVFKIAIKLQPESAIAHYGLGLEYIGAGDKGSALKEQEILKKLDASLAERLSKIISEE